MIRSTNAIAGIGMPGLLWLLFTIEQSHGSIGASDRGGNSPRISGVAVGGALPRSFFLTNHSQHLHALSFHNQLSVATTRFGGSAFAPRPQSRVARAADAARTAIAFRG